MPKFVRIWLITAGAVVGLIVAASLWEALSSDTEDRPWPAAMGLARCPPTAASGAPGYVGDHGVHPAVVVLARAQTGFQSPDRIQWLAAEWPGPIDWPHRLDWPSHPRVPLQVPAAWLAADVESLEQVICITAVSVADAEVEVCPYQGGGRITRVRGDVRVEAIDARTGTVRGEVVVPGSEPDPCPEYHTFGAVPAETWRGEPPGVADIVEAIGAFVSG